MELIALPCPSYSSGEKLAMNRGAGLCLMKSDEKREEAAMTFLKWITAPENNVKFVTQAGYMPVTDDAFENYLPDAIGSLQSPRYKSLYNAFIEMQKDYRFYTPPQYSFYLDKETWFEKNVRQILSEESSKYYSEIGDKNNIKDDEKSKLLKNCVDESLESLKDIN